MITRIFHRAVFCAAVLLAVPESQSCSPGGTTTSIDRIPAMGGSSYWVSSMNASGEVTGFAYLPGNGAAHAYRFGDSGYLDLGTLGGDVSAGYAINSFGDVVGYSSDAFSSDHAFLFANGVMIDLGTLGGGTSRAWALNDAGQVVGEADSPSGTEAFLYENGQMKGLGSLSDWLVSSWAVGINPSGVIIGNSLTDFFDQHAFVYNKDQMTDLGDLGGGYSAALAISDTGVVAGESRTIAGETHAVVFSAGQIIDLGTLGGTSSTAVGINKAGQVIGTSTTSTNTTRGFIYSGDVLHDLGSFGGNYTEPTAINNLGHVVGYSTTPSHQTRPFLWRNGSMVDLNKLLSADSKWVLSRALFINDSGCIVGYGTCAGEPAYFRMIVGGQNLSPIASAGPNQAVECGSAAVLDASASSDPDGDALTYEWSMGGTILGSGAVYSGVFPLGENAVTVKVMDACGASAVSSVIVTVTDTTAPQFASMPAPVSVGADAHCQAVVPDFLPSVMATDGCGGSVALSQRPTAGTLVASGQHTVTLEAADISGNVATAEIPFTVVDRTAPELQSVSVFPNVILTPNRQMVPVTCSAAAVDSCDPELSLKIVMISCNEVTLPGDAVITGDLTANLAATRDSGGDGRIYTITLEARDRSGNVSVGTATVTVPKGRGSSK